MYWRQGILIIWLIKVAVDFVSTLEEMSLNFIHTEILSHSTTLFHFVHCKRN